MQLNGGQKPQCEPSSHFFMATIFPKMAVYIFRRMSPATLQTLFRNSSRCWFGLHTLLILIRPRVCGICWKNNSDPWRSHNLHYKDLLLTSWCKIPEGTFRGLVESKPQRVRVILVALGAPTQYLAVKKWVF